MPAKTAPVAATHVPEKAKGRSGPCPRFGVASSAGDNAGSGRNFAEILRRIRSVGMIGEAWSGWHLEIGGFR